jgi:hypothetical protein
MRSVYIETTIPSYFAESRSTTQAIAWRDATREWWANAGSRYRCVTSRFVMRELSMAPEPKRTVGLAMLSRVELLEEPPELSDVIAYYLEHRLMPADAVGDAAHLASASLAGVDFLVTWNLRHLANANKFRHAEVLNARMGLPTPLMVTPYALLAENEDE